MNTLREHIFALHQRWTDDAIQFEKSAKYFTEERPDLDNAQQMYEAANDLRVRADELKLALDSSIDEEMDVKRLREVADAMLPIFESMRPLVLNLERLKDAATRAKR